VGFKRVSFNSFFPNKARQNASMSIKTLYENPMVLYVFTSAFYKFYLKKERFEGYLRKVATTGKTI
jgi:hypothetical protein